MELINDKSQQVPVGELELFGAPFTQTSVSDDILTQHRPIGSLDSDHPIEFLVHSAPNEYINLRETIFYLKLHFKLSRTDDTNIGEGDWDSLTTTNNLLHSLFESVSMKIGENSVNSANTNYAYRSYFDMIFNTGQNALDTYGKACLFEMNEEKRRAAYKPIESKIGGKINESKTLDLGGKLHLDLSFQDRAILGGSTLKFKLMPHKPNFYIKIKNNSKLRVDVVFEDAFLETHRSKVYDPIVQAHNAALTISPAIYPIQRMEVKSHLLPKGSLDAYIDHAIVGVMPRRIYVGLVSNESYNGSLETDPFTFEHFNLTHIATYLNANTYPNQPYKPQFDKGMYTREYLGLFGASNQLFCNTKSLIKMADYPNKFCIYGFNFSPDLSDGCNSSGHTALVKRGNLRIEFHFKAALPKTVSAIIFSEYDSILNINIERNAMIEL